VESPQRTVLIVDDEEPFLLSLADGLASSGSHFRVVMATSGEAALELLDRLTVDLVVTDLKMPGMDGLELIRRLRDRHPGLPVMVMTAFKSSQAETALARFLPLAILDKPLDFREFVDAINTALFPRPGKRPTLVTTSLAALTLLVCAASASGAFVWAGGGVAGHPAELEFRLNESERRFAPCSDPRA
jgi:DNA-binding response OmpR family regulator